MAYNMVNFSFCLYSFVDLRTVRAVDPFGQSYRPNGVQLPGWDFAFLVVDLSGFVKYKV